MIWDQHSEQLQGVVKFVMHYEVKEEFKETTWLLQKKQCETVGIESLDKKQLSYINVLVSLKINQQGNEEVNESCMKGVNMRVDSLKLSGRGMFFQVQIL